MWRQLYDWPAWYTVAIRWARRSSYSRALSLYSDFFHATVPGERGRRAAEAGILYAQTVAVGRPGFLEAGPERAAHRGRRYRRPVRAQRGSHRHRAAVGGTAPSTQVRFAAGVRHRYRTAASWKTKRFLTRFAKRLDRVYVSRAPQRLCGGEGFRIVVPKSVSYRITTKWPWTTPHTIVLSNYWNSVMQ